ncbi:hypothetical protein [Limosilactobacillus portuensis]|uniref:hypothetical protein n=1 Tax=Limosilactobacillus portuensis TaxID=2742601 RepID=UPI002358C674|nr:hypothetical protein [Limosilactobacillus portuensis]WCT60455.1 hypothetical protein PRK60_07760 [Limosilactobacillus portuensis]
MSEDMNYKSLFIGDKSENGSVYMDELKRLVTNHLGWRKDYIPSDIPAITDSDQTKKEYQDSLRRQHEVLTELDQRLRPGTIPWMSAGRYWGQMNSDTLMPAMLAYCYALL